MEDGFQLKALFNEELVHKLALDMQRVYKDFDAGKFKRAVVAELEPLSLTERAQMTMEKMAQQLPEDYPSAIKIIVSSFGPEATQTAEWGNEVFYYMPHCNYIAKYGIEHFDLSMHAMYEVTKRFTAEFAIRPFITRYPKESLKVLHKWVTDSNAHVRRLVSEGTRPRLPWAPRLREFQEDPTEVLALLELLKEDKELYVRRSVANNLNDIAKDHPDLVVDVLIRWKAIKNSGTHWIVGHASRTLVKSGHGKALLLLGYNPNVKVSLARFEVGSEVRSGDSLFFTLEITSKEKEPVELMIDYIVHYMKANGKQSPKVFKLTKKTIAPKGTIRLTKSQSFKPIGTRRHYSGKHSIEIQINGKPMGKKDFELLM